MKGGKSFLIVLQSHQPLIAFLVSQTERCDGHHGMEKLQLSDLG